MSNSNSEPEAVQPEDLYELESISDNPLFRRFAYKDAKAPSLLGRECRDEDLTPGFADSDENRNWSQPSFRDTWEPVEVIGKVAEYHDFPMLAGMPVFSERACTVLRDLLEPNGELLSLKSETKIPYFFYNVTRIVDSLDSENSDCRFWCEPPTTATNIRYFAFHPERLGGLSIFRIPESPMLTIVSNQFVKRVVDAGLTGFRFTKIWPLPEGTNWRIPRQKIETTNTDKFQLTAQTLILCFNLQGSMPTDDEKRRLKVIEDSIDAELKVESLADTYYGQYEVTSIDDNEYRMFLSTPDVNSLVERLTLCIKSVDWPAGFRVIKSDGRIHDDDSRQEPVQI